MTTREHIGMTKRKAKGRHAHRRTVRKLVKERIYKNLSLEYEVGYGSRPVTDVGFGAEGGSRYRKKK